MLEFASASAQIAGEIRATLEAHGTPIGHYDLLIATQAIALAATLVAFNVSEFQRVAGLIWEDWST